MIGHRPALTNRCRATGWRSLFTLLLAGLTAWAGEPVSPPPAPNSAAVPERIVFAVRQQNYDGHWYANFGYYADSQDRKAYRAEGRLCVLETATGKVRDLINDPAGSIRDPQVHYDGKTILFAYRKGGTDNYLLYEIQADGTGLKQLTDGPYDDFEPTYLPDGDIVFVSSRCRRWVNCWLTQVAVLHRCDRSGHHIHPISANIEQDNTPWPLPDGRILYTRWEYVDRSQVDYHHLWTANPDGTSQMVYYGNLHPGIVMIDAKPLPGTDDIVALFSPGHGNKEHAGAVTILSSRQGPDQPAAARRITKGEDFRDPYPLNAREFLVAQYASIQWLNTEGKTRELYHLPKELEAAGAWCHEPRPLAPRAPEAAIPSRIDGSKTSGRLFLANIYEGRNMTGVRPGEIRKLLVMESLPKPINYTGGMEPLSYGGTFTLSRILGTVPVEEDGSAFFEAPALRSLFLIALDEQNQSIKRMQSFLSLMPGETTSCVGCHENRVQAPTAIKSKLAKAVSRPPSAIQPIAGIPEVFDFPRDIQPILDRHCVRCHGWEKREGKVVLAGDHGPMYSHSYYTLTCWHQVADGRNEAKSNLAPKTIGATASPLMAKIDGRHHGVRLSEPEANMIRFWIESSAPYPGTYAALGCGMIGGYHENQIEKTGNDWPESKAAKATIARRCAACHQGRLILPSGLSDEREISFWRPDFNDPRLLLSRHIVFNLSRPEKSLMLLAPLAANAGGYGLCQDSRTNGAPIFASPQDPDYQTLLALSKAGQKELERHRRFDMAGFQPTPMYLREMKRYGIWNPDPGSAAAPVDVYQLDRAYWREVTGWQTREKNK